VLRTCQGCGGEFPSRKWLSGGLCEACRYEALIQGARAEAQIWAEELLAAPGDWVILDAETTGLDAQDEIVQLAVLAADGQILLDSLVRPTCPIHPQAQAIHGITAEMVATAPPFPEIYPRLRTALGDKKIIAYNVAFDRDFVQASCRQSGLPEIENRWSCAMRAYAKYYGDWSEHWNSFKNQPLMGDHTAAGDCRAVLALIHALASPEGAPHENP
jgi:DNA polymerase-3 subunit epsilon